MQGNPQHRDGVFRRAGFRGGIIAGLLLLLFWPLRISEASPFGRALLDGLHVPLFMALVVALDGCYRVRLPRFRALGWAVLLGVVIALGSEPLQPLMGRDFSWGDLGRNLVGVVAGAVLVTTLRVGSLPSRMAAIVLAMAAMVIGFYPAFEIARAGTWRVAQVPLLGDFEDERELLFWEVSGEGGTTEISVSDEFASRGGFSLRVRTGPGGYPGVRHLAGSADWSEYDTLLFDIYNPGEDFPFGIRIDWGGAAPPKDRRANFGWEIGHGRHAIRVPLNQLGENEEDAASNRREIIRLVFHLGLREEAHEFFLDAVRLE